MVPKHTLSDWCQLATVLSDLLPKYTTSLLVKVTILRRLLQLPGDLFEVVLDQLPESERLFTRVLTPLAEVIASTQNTLWSTFCNLALATSAFVSTATSRTSSLNAYSASTVLLRRFSQKTLRWHRESTA